MVPSRRRCPPDHGFRAAVTLALVHSPLVGSLTWQAVAEVLRDEGEVVVVPDLTRSVTLGPPVLPAV